nr:MAG: putative RNA-dependent RNA polymerase [Narnaviridae sp.]
MSLHFQRKLSFLLYKKRLPAVKAWFYTTNGVVLPIILSAYNPDKHLPCLDSLVKWSLENCANNYAVFISRFKKVKKLLRKAYALQDENPELPTDMYPYVNAYRKLRKYAIHGVTDIVYLCIWTQTRASGLADGEMIHRSVEKMISTITTPSPDVVLNKDILFGCLGDFSKVDGRKCHVSSGPAATLQSTRQTDGQAGFIKALTRNPSLTREYNLITLEYKEIEPRPVRSVHDLVSWAVQEVHMRPTYVRAARVHAVAEPSKARTITVSNFALQVIFGVIARMFTPALVCQHVVGGLKASRHLWRFLKEDLDPTDTLWGELSPYGIYGVSCDLEEATDYGNMSVARQILQLAIQRASSQIGDQFPLGLAVLAKTMYLSPRYIFYRNRSGWSWATKQRGWLMGDRLTKYVLTVAHDYVLHAANIKVANIVGDDVAILTNNQDDGPRYKQGLIDAGFKPSEDDYFVSNRLLFYCEEAASVPQTLDDLPAPALRRKEQSCYQDYPRIRLMIPNTSETEMYSSTNSGRFALLGKEARWVSQNSRNLIPLFERAVRMQHLLLPTDKDTLCQFTPIEMGGDGSFTNDPSLLRGVIEARSRDPQEVYYRIHSMMDSTWSHRYVRSERKNEVVHKHHLMVPILEETKRLIPESAIIEGDTLLLNSIRVPQIEKPEETTFRLWRSYYYAEVFAGREPKLPTFDVERTFHGGGSRPQPRLDLFISRWRDDGFTYHDVSPYLVIKSEVNALDYLNLGWYWPPGERTVSAREQIGDAVIQNRIWNDTNMELFLRHIQSDTALPNHVRDRLYRFVDSDNYLAREVGRWEDRPSTLILISKDVKLARRLAGIMAPKRGPMTHTTTRRRVRTYPFWTWWHATIGMSKSTYYRDLNRVVDEQLTELRGHTIPENTTEVVTETQYAEAPTTIIMVEPKTYNKGALDQVENTLVSRGYEATSTRTLIDYGAVNFSQFTEYDSYMEYDDWETNLPEEHIEIVPHPRHRGIAFANLVQGTPTPLVWDPVANDWRPQGST